MAHLSTKWQVQPSLVHFSCCQKAHRTKSKSISRRSQGTRSKRKFAATNYHSNLFFTRPAYTHESNAAEEEEAWRTS